MKIEKELRDKIKDNIYYETELGILLCGDCLELMSLFPDNYFDLVLTDPPYGVNSNEMNGINYKDEFYNIDKISKELFRLLKKNTRVYVFSAQKTCIEVVLGFEKSGFNLHQTLIWYRPNLAGETKKKIYDFTNIYEQILNFHKDKSSKLKKVEGFNNFDVLKYAQPQSNFKKDKRYHIHQKPLKLIEHLILVSTSKSNLILDCFLGSGTTALACEKLNRRWIGIEISEEYCKIAKKRIKQEADQYKLQGI